MSERDWKAEALLWERRTNALRGVVDVMLMACMHTADHTNDPPGAMMHFRRVKEAFDAMMRREDLGGPNGEVDFKERVLGEIEHRFESLRATLNRQLRERQPDAADVLGEAPKPKLPTLTMPAWCSHRAEQLGDLFMEIHERTQDDDPRDLVLRAMAVYRSFVVHARAGGQVKFIKEGAPDRILKVRLR